MNTEYAVISPSDPWYPENLKSIMPNAQLYAIGNLELLGKPAVGICGSREASPKALSYALIFGKEAAKKGFVVVSGYARGVDREAHKGALEAKGATIAVLPEGIKYFRLVPQLELYADLHHNFLAISSFEPEAVWKSWQAMERNKLIVALSIGIFVVEAREKGGTINAAMECVRQKKKLWAIAYPKGKTGSEGNRKLLQDSAIPLKCVPDLQKALEESLRSSPDGIKQLALNLG